MRPGFLVSSVFGIVGFIGFGLWAAVLCSVFWIGHPINCGWVFIVVAPIGFLTGIVKGGLGFWLIIALARLSGR